MTLWAISDLHITHPVNREALEELPEMPDDWLIVAGDVTNGTLHLDWCFRILKQRFRTVVWVPGNHELWSGKDGPRGKALYDTLVATARSHGIITPDDPWRSTPEPARIPSLHRSSFSMTTASVPTPWPPTR